MDYNIRVEDTTQQELSQEDKNYLINMVPSWWDEWDNDRDKQKRQYDKLEIASNIDIINSNRQSETYLLPNVYEQKQTYKSYLWKSWFSNLNSLFDVQGKSYEDQMNAPAQKARLLSALHDMNINLELDKALEHWVSAGEMIFFVGWETSYRFRRVPTTQADPMTGETVSSFNLEQTVDYDGAKIKAVDPFSFVYDKTAQDNMDRARKIRRYWYSLSQIEECGLFSLTKEDLAHIRYLVGESTELVQLPDVDYETLKQKAVNGGNVEVLELWGDFYVNGKLYKNYIATVVGRTVLARFEANPFVDSPFVMATYLQDKEYCRGISPLLPTVVLNQIASAILSLQLQALKLEIDKPILAIKGTIKDRVKIKAGTVIEYTPPATPELKLHKPEFLDFSGARMGWEFLPFFEQAIEKSTGLFKMQTGSQDGKYVTATVGNNIMSSQNVRQGRDGSIISLHAIVPMIEKLARLLSNFEFGDKQVLDPSSPIAQPNFVPVNDGIRQGDYRYIYGDITSIAEAKAQIQEVVGYLANFKDIPEFRNTINLTQLIKYGFTRLNIPNPTDFINVDPIDAMFTQMQIPPEMQPMLRQQVAQAVPTIVQSLMQAQGGPNGQTVPDGTAPTPQQPPVSSPQMPLQ